jgi:hyaluronan synthase
MYKIFVTLLPALAVTSIVLFLYLESVTALHVFAWYLTSYGILTLFNYTLQFALAMMNRQWVESLPPSNESSSVSVHVVGYKEDADYFRKCLESANNLNYRSLNRIIIVIDGKDMADTYMSEIARSVFGNACACITLPELLQAGNPENNNRLLEKYIVPCAQKQALCIMQPHGGKRCALYTATKISSFMGYEYFFNTDSDTILPPGILQPMVDCMVYDRGIGAVAGALDIFNTDHSFLAAMSHARYYFAFNVERAAQSFFGVVMCVSGPNGLYRTQDVEQIIDKWYTQKFLGKPCAAGDDR